MRPLRSHLRPRSGLLGRLRGFARAEGGAAAVETALVAVPFLLLVFGVVEIGMIFLVASSLENATATAARTIRTGELQTGASPTQTDFKSAICGNFGWMQSDCAANLSVDVRTYASFQTVTAPQPLNNGVFDPSALTYNPGGPSDIVVVRAYYPWPLVAPGLTHALATVAGDKVLLTSTATFRNEPYGS